MKRVRYVVGLAAAFALSCRSSPSAPGGAGALPTLDIMNNPTCAAGACRTLEVRAFVWAFQVPQPPWGWRVLGEMPGGTACLAFPASWTFRVIGPADTTIFTWTPNSASGIYVVVVDSALFHAGTVEPSSTILGLTRTFVPGTASGWQATFSGSAADPTTAAPAHPCNP